MSNKFTRNITGTKLRGEVKEPFYTNVQNDLLSDDTDVYVRQERSEKIPHQYHCLTDNVKEVISNSDLISTENFEHGNGEQEEKNKSYINVNKSNKTESEKMESNSHVMTPLQTGYSIEKNNRDVIPTLVKQHETPTEITSKSDELVVTKKGKNNFELELELENSNPPPADDVNITSKSEYLNVNEIDHNNYEISLDKSKLDELINNNKLEIESSNNVLSLMPHINKLVDGAFESLRILYLNDNFIVKDINGNVLPNDEENLLAMFDFNSFYWLMNKMAQEINNLKIDVEKLKG